MLKPIYYVGNVKVLVTACSLFYFCALVVTCTSLSLDRLKLWSSLKVPLIDDRPLEDKKENNLKKEKKSLKTQGANPINYYATYATGTGSLTLECNDGRTCSGWYNERCE